MLDILRTSGGGGVTVEDEAMIVATREVGAAEGLFVAPEGAACFVALRKLLKAGKIAAADRVVIFNTGSGIKYLDCYDAS
jgi:threonine synthase